MSDSGDYIALLDVDGTLVDGSVGIEFTAHAFPDEYPYTDGIKPAVAAYMQNTISYPEMVDKVVDHWRAGLKDRTVDEITEQAAAFIDDYPVPDAATNVVQALADNGYAVHLVSVTPQEVLEPFAAQLGPVTAVHGTRLCVEDGRYTGDLAATPATDRKQPVAQRLLDDAEPVTSLAVGDTVQDVGMFHLVDIAVLIAEQPPEDLIETTAPWDHRFPDLAAFTDAIPELSGD